MTSRRPLRTAVASGRNARTPSTIDRAHSGNLIALPGGGISVRIPLNCTLTRRSFALAGLARFDQS
jgi:hypothetical protein